MSSANPLDAAALLPLQVNDLEPAAQSTDEEFLRRLYVGLLGRVPTEEELDEFRSVEQENKRAAQIDALIGSVEFADHWADEIGTWLNVEPEVTEDVNGDGKTTAIDALMIINYLAREDDTPMPAGAAAEIISDDDDDQDPIAAIDVVLTHLLG